MIKFLTGNKGFLKAFVDKQYEAYFYEDISYRGAYLAKLRQNINDYIEENDKFPDDGIFSKF